MKKGAVLEKGYRWEGTKVGDNQIIYSQDFNLNKMGSLGGI